VFGWAKHLVLEQSWSNLLNFQAAALAPVLARSFPDHLLAWWVCWVMPAGLSMGISRLAKWVTQCGGMPMAEWRLKSVPGQSQASVNASWQLSATL